MAEIAAPAPAASPAPPAAAPVPAAPVPAAVAPTAAAPAAARIDIQRFMEVELRMGRVLTCEAVPKSSKLLRFSVDIGEAAPRQILAGIAREYRPEELVGAEVVVVANLEPAKLMGLESQGMLLAATDPEGRPILLRPHKPGAVPGHACGERLRTRRLPRHLQTFGGEEIAAVLTRPRAGDPAPYSRPTRPRSCSPSPNANRASGAPSACIRTRRRAGSRATSGASRRSRASAGGRGGECGLDFHYDHAPRPVQEAVFRTQCSSAIDLGLPVIVHNRESDDRLSRPRRAGAARSPPISTASPAAPRWRGGCATSRSSRGLGNGDLQEGRERPRGAAALRRGPAPRRDRQPTSRRCRTAASATSRRTSSRSRPASPRVRLRARQIAAGAARTSSASSRKHAPERGLQTGFGTSTKVTSSPSSRARCSPSASTPSRSPAWWPTAR